MKRRVLVLLGVAIALLVLPGVALAASRFYRGAAGPGVHSDIEVTARLAKAAPHRPTKLTRIEWANVPASCGRFGTSATSDFFPDDIPVTKGGSFHATAKLNRGRETVTFGGSFSNHNRAVSGTIRIRGTIPGCPTADTGVVSWHAKPPAAKKKP